MDVFAFRDRLVDEYGQFSRSFARIRAEDIAAHVSHEYQEERFWPAPMVQLNPSFVPGADIGGLVAEGLLHAECERIFRANKTEDGNTGTALTLHKHQEEALRIAERGESYVLTTGTGSGKSLSYFIPIVNHVLRRRAAGEAKRISAIVVYPMNALCNSQMEELKKFLIDGYGEGKELVRFARYTGQEKEGDRTALAANPPDILLTNYVMLELMLTRHASPDPQIVKLAEGLRFLVLDELHTYRGRQGADVAMLVRRVRDRMNPDLLCVGTSATMASEGTAAERSQVVADVASRLFGAPVKPANVVTETLRRVTTEEPPADAAALASAVADGVPMNADYSALRCHPIAAWVETTLGLQRQDNRPDGKWVRTSAPKTVLAAGKLLREASGRPLDECCDFLRRFLLLAFSTLDEHRRPLFAFRLHQFIAGAGDVFTTLEPPGVRYLTLDGQQFRPGDRDKPLFPVVFCRSCGQEYLPVWAAFADRQPVRITDRELNEKTAEDDGTIHGYFMPDPDSMYDGERYPDEWLETVRDGTQRLRQTFRRYRPVPFCVSTKGDADAHGLAGWVIPGAFRFCLNPDCEAVFDGSVRSEISKLSSLSSEGRSSATTVLTVAAMRHLLQESSLPDSARKLLGFTDNRQDASLQAGHLNDFVMILLLRGALLASLRNQPDGTLTDDVLTHRVFEHLRLSSADYASVPDAKGAKAEGARRALRDVLGYRLYFDLRRGWRFTHPNLEQLGLLSINYSSLEECASDQEEWSKCHSLLAAATPTTRQKLLRELLDRMRRELCIKTIYLDGDHMEQVRNRSYAELREPWGLADEERLMTSAAMIPRPKRTSDRIVARTMYLSHRSAFGRRVRATLGAKITVDEGGYNDIVDHMLKVLGTYGLVEKFDIEGEKGYRVPASVIEWRLGSDEQQDNANQFFLDLYDNVAEMLRGDDRFLHRLQAREHTAQVPQDDRIQREAQFRTAALPILYCSPTMELGVDIKELNTVYMRNVPPTPANYAQRSGRAGRSGQPALVITYCAARSPHDQWFFRKQASMVAGVVNPPSLDLTNEDLIRSHLHAVWLGETGVALGPSVQHVLDREQTQELPLLDNISAQIDRPAVRRAASARGIAILGMLRDTLTPQAAPWYTADWLDHTIRSAHLSLNSAFERWRTLFKATREQMDRSHAIQMNAAADEKTRKDASDRYREASRQQGLLLDGRGTMSSDFYAYRYLASEGFIPGYNFPRLPLLAYIPPRREKIVRDNFLSRPRFLGLSEFGPRSIIYHEGSTYRVRRAILTPRDAESIATSSTLPVRRCRLCDSCGYGHFDDQADHDRCVNCDSKLGGLLTLLDKLYRIDQVSTQRADRITSDEEERQRQGYEMITTLRYAEQDGIRRFTPVIFKAGETSLLTASYGPAATVWRINLGWRRRKNKGQFGFNIDVASGEWSRDEQAPEGENDDAPDGKVIQRIIPFVEDRRNVLLLRPSETLSDNQITTLAFALKRGIESIFQLEDSELAAEPLPDKDRRNAILFYEAAEGGAGVLTRIATDPQAIRRVAKRALEVCHFTSPSGLWADAAELENTDQGCEAGCYRCLLSYSNQPEHERIDRKDPALISLLCRLVHADTQTGNAAGVGAEDAYAVLQRLCGSGLERNWLETVRTGGYRLPDRAQPLLMDFSTQPDFAYDQTKALIYVDGPHHRDKNVKQMDDTKRRSLRDAGYKVVVFTEDKTGWPKLFASLPFIFGKGNA